jgi:hypothetical protein
VGTIAGRVIRDLAVMGADGGECVSGLGAVASDSTAFGTVDRIASEQVVGELGVAHARAWERFWELHGAPDGLTIDVEETLITAHSENAGRPEITRAGSGFHPSTSRASRS